MPLNEIEQHPYLNYFKQFHGGEVNVPWEKYTRLFIGSFPVYEITNTIFPVDKILDRSITPKVGFWNFYYGSKTNSFWKYLLSTFQANDYLENYDQLLEDDLICFLETKQILLTDAIVKTNRFNIEKGKDRPFSPSDSGLVNKKANANVQNQFQLNSEIINWLTKATNIDSVYFTAKGETGKTPGGWLHKVLKKERIKIDEVNRSEFCVNYNIGKPVNRQLTFYFLPTPSASRSINLNEKKTPHTLFLNYVEFREPMLFKKLSANAFKLTPIDKNQLQPLREAFIKEWWEQFIIKKHKAYDGSNPLI